MRYLTILVMLLALNSCQTERPEMKKQLADLQAELAATKAELVTAQTDPTGFIHAVYFWYNDNITDERKATFQNSLDELAKVKSIESVYYGRSAVSERDVVDDSYDLAWICTFADSSAQEAYQIDPIHLKFVNENKDLWSKVLVYDSYAGLEQ